MGKDNIKSDSLNEPEMQNLWFKRNYAALLAVEAERLELDLEKTALIYGEINLPTYGDALENQQFIYNEQLGLVKK